MSAPAAPITAPVAAPIAVAVATPGGAVLVLRRPAPPRGAS